MVKPKLRISVSELDTKTKRALWDEFLFVSGFQGGFNFNEEHFSADVAVFELAKNHLKFWNSESFKVDRTQSDCWRIPRQHFLLGYVKKGSVVVSQAGREALVQNGDCFLLDTSEPGSFQAVSKVDIVSLSCSPTDLERWMPHPKDITAVSFSSHSRWGKALASTMDAFTPDFLDHPFVEKGVIIDHLQSLLGLCSDQSSCSLGKYQSTMLRRLRQGMRDHFHEPDFSPNTLIVEQKIPRHVFFSVFAKAGTSFGQELLVLRMQKARMLLEDFRHNNKSIAEIARLVGYTYPGHFRYIISPIFWRDTSFVPKSTAEIDCFIPPPFLPFSSACSDQATAYVSG